MDEVYVCYFKCGFASLNYYPNILRYTGKLYFGLDKNGISDGVSEKIRAATSIDDIKKHYFTSHAPLNPYAVVPAMHSGLWARMQAAAKED